MKADIDAQLLAEIRARDEEVHVSPQWVGWAHSPFAQFIADRRLLLAFLDRAAAVAIEWWVCAWCDARFPYTDGPDTLKAHSSTCPGHPAVQQLAQATAAENERIAVRLEEAITALMMKGMLLNDAEIGSLYAALR